MTEDRTKNDTAGTTEPEKFDQVSGDQALTNLMNELAKFEPPECIGWSNEKLDTELYNAVNLKLANGTKAPYADVRDDILDLNREMNTRGVRPPAFRPSRKVPAKGTLTADSKQLSEDRKVNDLHWLHCQGYREKLNDAAYEDLMLDEEFDFDRAAEFAQEKWRTEVRVDKILLLTPEEEMQMAVLLTEGTRQRRNEIEEGALQFNRYLRSQSQRNGLPRADSIDDLVTLFKAYMFCNDSQQKMVAKVYGWMCGAPPLKPTSISQKLQRMRTFADAAATSVL